MRIPLVSQTFARGIGLPLEDVVNFYPETGSPSVFEYALISAPGLAQVTAIPRACRGLFHAPGSIGGALFGVFGQRVYRWTSDLASARVGLVADGTDRVKWAGPMHRKVIIAAPYLYELSEGGVVQITDPDLLAIGAHDLTYINGYWVIIPTDRRSFYFSTVNNPTGWAALDFFASDDHPGELVAVVEHRDELLLFGSRAIDRWVVTGDELLPFRPIQGSRIHRGLMARDAVCHADGVVYFVGEDGKVYRLAGAVERVSTHPIEAALSALSEADRAGVALSSHEWEGHTFVQVDAPGVATWLYDAATTRWHRRETIGSPLWRPSCWMTAFGRVFGGCRDKTGLVEMKLGVRDAGAPLIRTAIVHMPVDEGTPAISSVEVFGSTGVGAATGAETNPVIEIAWSDDLGRTWSADRHVPLGRIGEYRAQQTLHRLGRARAPGRAWRVRYDGTAPIALYGLGVNEVRRR